LPEERGRRKLVRRAYASTIVAARVVTVLAAAAIFLAIRAIAG
jgi:hypothetical protein